MRTCLFIALAAATLVGCGPKDDVKQDPGALAKDAPKLTQQQMDTMRQSIRNARKER